MRIYFVILAVFIIGCISPKIAYTDIHKTHSKAVEYAKKGNINKAKVTLAPNRKFYLANHMWFELARYYNDYGMIYKLEGELDSALSCFNLAVVYAQEADATELKKKTLENKYQTLIRKGLYLHAVRTKSIIASLSESDFEKAVCKLDLASLYVIQYDFGRAEQILDQIKNTAGIKSYSNYNNTLGVFYLEQNLFDEAIHYLNESIKYADNEYDILFAKYNLYCAGVQVSKTDFINECDKYGFNNLKKLFIIQTAKTEKDLQDFINSPVVEVQIDALKKLCKIKEASGDFYDLLDIRDSIDKIEMSLWASQISLIDSLTKESEKAKKEIQILKHKLRNKTLLLNIIIASLTVGTLIIAMILMLRKKISIEKRYALSLEDRYKDVRLSQVDTILSIDGIYKKLLFGGNPINELKELRKKLTSIYK